MYVKHGEYGVLHATPQAPIRHQCLVRVHVHVCVCTIGPNTGTYLELDVNFVSETFRNILCLCVVVPCR